ncbi:MAG: aldo/keto reductase, partial [Reyranella sp.]|nr:aldo/keto reductase [Reyranella sp.]
MEYRPLGNTGLSVSVAGLGCGGNSRLGLGRGASFDDCVAVVRTAVDTGVNFLDTAEAYGTEEIVGAAARCYDRDRLVISTKAIFRGADDTSETVAGRVEAALQRLGLDYVDVFHFHAVNPVAYDHHRDVLAPALLKLKEQGKVRHIGITETGPRDPEQKMLARAIEEAPWEVIMLAYSLMNQGARHKIF